MSQSRARGFLETSAKAKYKKLTGKPPLASNSHEYQKLPLAPVEEFLAKQPQHADADENALMAARIEDERTEREALEQQRQELLKRKQKLIAENKKRREDLANLDNDLEKFIDVSYSMPHYEESHLFVDVLI